MSKPCEGHGFRLVVSFFKRYQTAIIPEEKKDSLGEIPNM